MAPGAFTIDDERPPFTPCPSAWLAWLAWLAVAANVTAAICYRAVAEVLRHRFGSRS